MDCLWIIFILSLIRASQGGARDLANMANAYGENSGVDGGNDYVWSTHHNTPIMSNIERMKEFREKHNDMLEGKAKYNKIYHALLSFGDAFRDYNSNEVEQMLRKSQNDESLRLYFIGLRNELLKLADSFRKSHILVLKQANRKEKKHEIARFSAECEKIMKEQPRCYYVQKIEEILHEILQLSITMDKCTLIHDLMCVFARLIGTKECNTNEGVQEQATPTNQSIAHNEWFGRNAEYDNLYVQQSKAFFELCTRIDMTIYRGNRNYRKIMNHLAVAQAYSMHVLFETRFCAKLSLFPEFISVYHQYTLFRTHAQQICIRTRLISIYIASKIEAVLPRLLHYSSMRQQYNTELIATRLFVRDVLLSELLIALDTGINIVSKYVYFSRLEYAYLMSIGKEVPNFYDIFFFVATDLFGALRFSNITMKHSWDQEITCKALHENIPLQKVLKSLFPKFKRAFGMNMRRMLASEHVVKTGCDDLKKEIMKGISGVNDRVAAGAILKFYKIYQFVVEVFVQTKVNDEE
ncbi:hypothetical protein VCUG_00869 [Vavraia culicis subsp. floridensis]|uniref:Uncharacterized protein n=1 Tax=Vavraia culicis (isolate floridensis) TaxID=948595 RepID=L2GWJ3_VAVCU|nr:uncharacterized protein VCUG_00869 [Vavraia culicis subsp. floridensis]ELA47668.1 hypothetical protein VCUG_00869 [Vavraia culicis subsp. floridensis]